MGTSTKAPKGSARTTGEFVAGHAVADALARAASESCRQHERLDAVMRNGSPEVELEGIAAVAAASDAHVRTLVAAYEGAAPGSFADDAQRKAASALWMASREFVRRHDGCNLAERELKRHSAQKLTELHAEFELQASALLALRQAVTAYRKLRPDAAT
ncbi:MAG: hypothetical protein MUF53_00060 [Gemmatimonadaceae bacterium]|jgi:hypothetical protein|nr:hypothetical protein [Gemmatimonadaceae bacterium]